MPLADVRTLPARYTTAVDAAVAAGRRRPRSDAVGQIRPTPGRAEGRAFNHFPQIIAAFPDALSAIVKETTEAVARRAAAGAPEQANPRPGDPAPGTLKASVRTRYFKRRGTDLVQTGRVEFTAKDRRGHRYARPVEGGSIGRGKRRAPAEPFLVPAIMEERVAFVARAKTLEARLPK